MSGFSTKTEETTQKESTWISPGIHDVKITKIEAVEPEGKAPYLNLSFENTKGQTTDDKLYFSEAAKGYSETTLGDMKKAIGTDAEVTGKTLTEFAKNLFKVIGNKTFRHRFTGEEVQGKLDTETGKQKNNWFKARIGKKYSCESTTVKTTESRLKPLDKTNQYDWKTLPTADTTTSNGKTTSGDELPF
jgi:hypothetical protein